MTNKWERWDSILMEIFGPDVDCKHIWRFNELADHYVCSHCRKTITQEDISKVVLG